MGRNKLKSTVWDNLKKNFNNYNIWALNLKMLILPTNLPLRRVSHFFVTPKKELVRIIIGTAKNRIRTRLGKVLITWLYRCATISAPPVARKDPYSFCTAEIVNSKFKHSRFTLPYKSKIKSYEYL